MSADSGVIESQADFGEDPAAWAKRWSVEFKAAKQWSAGMRASGSVSVERFLDKREAGMPSGEQPTSDDKRARVNLYWANVVTQRALLYGRVPTVEVARRFADADDDEARVAGPLILERLLNTDIEYGEDCYKHTLRHSLSDYLLMGMATAKLRYTAELEDEEVPAQLDDLGNELAPGYTKQSKKKGKDGLPDENVVVDYIHWKDMLWSPCRTFEEMSWWAYATPMTKDEMGKRWGKDVAREINYNTKLIAVTETDMNDPTDPRRASAWTKAQVWEIWSKKDRKVFWYVEGHPEVLEIKDDPYELRGFWPFPEPLMANLTTDAFLPRSDFAMSQDLYNDINELSTRIALLERALKVAGVYDKTCGELERLVSEGYDNVMIPVANWPALQEKGGIAGAINWLPMDQVVGALDKLREQRQETKDLLFEVTGWSDLMRGEAGTPDESATSAGGRLKFASARLQHRQDEFARWATGVQQIRAELICKLYEPETIIARSNVMRTEDADQVQQAVELLKSEFPSYRVEVKSETLAQQDFAALRSERLEMLSGIAQLFQGAQPLQDMMGPDAVPLMVGLAKWAVSALRGSGTIEGFLDKAMQKALQKAKDAEQNPQQPEQDPKMAVVQAKAQSDMATVQAKAQADQSKAQITEHQMILKAQLETQRIQAKAQADVQHENAQMQASIQEEQQREALKTEGERQRQAMKPTPLPKGFT